MLVYGYALDDLVSAGLPSAVSEQISGSDWDPLEKWNAVAEYVDAARLTGYMRALDSTTTRLFGLRLGPDTCEEIDRRLRSLREPGYYRRVLNEVANVERCQVNSVDHDPFCETEMPDLLDQDISITALVRGYHASAESRSGIDVGTLDDYVRVIDWVFGRYARDAVAVKCWWAYFRSLAVASVDSPPRRSFARLRRGTDDKADRHRVEDFLFRHCVNLATEAGLPVKLHMGTLARNWDPHLTDCHACVTDVTPLVQEYPRTTFVLMHTAWPEQEQLLALAKHQPNVVVECSWSWTLAPRSTAEFIQRFLTTVPATKLLCFGGDYVTVENVVGHAELARRGLQSALEGLVDSGWITMEDAIALVPLLMRENAERRAAEPGELCGSGEATGRQAWHARPGNEDRAGKWLFLKPRLIEFPARARDVQVAPVLASECAAGYLTHRQLDHVVERASSRISVHSRTAPERHPDTALGVHG